MEDIDCNEVKEFNLFERNYYDPQMNANNLNIVIGDASTQGVQGTSTTNTTTGTKKRS